MLRARRIAAHPLRRSRRLTNASSQADLSHLTYRYDADGNIGGVTHLVTPANSVIYGYDANWRLNLAVAETGTAGTDSYAYTAGTNRLASLTTAAGTRTIAYDGRGNTSGETRPGGTTVTTGYDGHGRLTWPGRRRLGSDGQFRRGRGLRRGLPQQSAGLTLDAQVRLGGKTKSLSYRPAIVAYPARCRTALRTGKSPPRKRRRAFPEIYPWTV